LQKELMKKIAIVWDFYKENFMKFYEKKHFD